MELNNPITHRPFTWGWRDLTYLSVCLGFWLILAFLSRHPQLVFQYDFDEGLTLIKGVLLQHGYQPFQDFWSDQPLGYPRLYSLWLQVSETSILWARSLTMVFTGLLLVSLYTLLRRYLPPLPSSLAIVALVNTKHFVNLSVSAMIGLPALALGMVALALVPHDRAASLSENRTKVVTGRDLAAVACLILAMQIKLMAILLLPGWFWLQAYSYRRSPWPSQIKYLLLQISFLSVGVASLVLSQYLGWEELFQTHIEASVDNVSGSGWEKVANYLNKRFASDYLFFIISCLGIGNIIFFRKNVFILIFPTLLLLTILFFYYYHEPLWFHHYPLFAIPLIYLFGFGADLLLGLAAHPNFKTSRIWQLFWLVLLVVPFAQQASLAWEESAQWQAKRVQQEFVEERALVNTIVAHQADTRYLAADLPIFNFHAGILPIPDLAVISDKRWDSGQIDQDQILKGWQQYQPEQILLGRYKKNLLVHPQIIDFLQQHYFLRYGSDSYQLYWPKSWQEHG